ncbi:MAG TPA: VOC family protein [Chitinophagaceae bacterium]
MLRIKEGINLLLICMLCSTQLFSQDMNQKKSTVLNHIAVYVYDLQKSTDFYSGIIGLDTIPEPFHDGKHTWYRIGPHSHLHLIQGATTISTHDKNSHLCFSVPSVEDFTDILKKNNIEFENWAGDKNQVTARVDGVKQIYFRDPDGYWLEINDDKY